MEVLLHVFPKLSQIYVIRKSDSYTFLWDFLLKQTVGKKLSCSKHPASYFTPDIVLASTVLTLHGHFTDTQILINFFFVLLTGSLNYISCPFNSLSAA